MGAGPKPGLGSPAPQSPGSWPSLHKSKICQPEGCFRLRMSCNGRQGWSLWSWEQYQGFINRLPVAKQLSLARKFDRSVSSSWEWRENANELGEKQVLRKDCVPPGMLQPEIFQHSLRLRLQAVVCLFLVQGIPSLLFPPTLNEQLILRLSGSCLPSGNE